MKEFTFKELLEKAETIKMTTCPSTDRIYVQEKDTKEVRVMLETQQELLSEFLDYLGVEYDFYGDTEILDIVYNE